MQFDSFRNFFFGRYRKNVAAIITNSKREILIAQRRDNGLWQFPQGGIEVNETKEEAIKRELKEETSLKTFKIIDQTPRPLKYKWSPKKSGPNGYIGQEQTYFLIEVSPDAVSKELRVSDDFVEFQFLPPQKILEICHPLKKEIYRLALSYFDF